jgi:hypothetical protein
MNAKDKAIKMNTSYTLADIRMNRDVTFLRLIHNLAIISYIIAS